MRLLALSASAAVGASAAEQTPIQKVVGLLQQMASNLEEEKEKDGELYYYSFVLGEGKGCRIVPLFHYTRSTSITLPKSSFSFNFLMLRKLKLKEAFGRVSILFPYF